MTFDRTSEVQRGVLFGTAAYVVWGVFPLYLPLVHAAGSLEILAHRIVWSLIALVTLLSIRRRWSSIHALAADRRRLGLLFAAATAIAVNWGIFIFAVNTDHVIEASLGYFITPLVSVLFGVAILRERLRPWQWVAIGLGALAVVVLTVDYSGLPWMPLVIAVTFGTYALLTKLANAPAVESLAVQMMVLFAPALVYVLALEAHGAGTFVDVSLAHALLLIGTGVVFTTVPFILFSAAVVRVPLTVIGMLQYLNPAMQFLIGILIVNEDMPQSRWLGFGLVWAGLLILTVDSLRAPRASQVGRHVGTPTSSTGDAAAIPVPRPPPTVRAP